MWQPQRDAGLLEVVTYAMLGVLVGSLFGRLGGLCVMFLLPFLDVGLAALTLVAAAERPPRLQDSAPPCSCRSHRRPSGMLPTR